MIERKTESLTAEEVASLKGKLNNTYLIGMMMGIMSIVLSLMLSFAFLDNIQPEYYIIIPLILILTTSGTWIGTRKRRLEIAGGYKELNWYQIVDRRSYWDDEPGLGGMKMKYVLRSDRKEFFVEKLIYYQAQIGDHLIEHETPLTRETLKIEIVKEVK
jgi:hypothetical protein